MGSGMGGSRSTVEIPRRRREHANRTEWKSGSQSESAIESVNSLLRAERYLRLICFASSRPVPDLAFVHASNPPAGREPLSFRLPQCSLPPLNLIRATDAGILKIFGRNCQACFRDDRVGALGP